MQNDRRATGNSGRSWRLLAREVLLYLLGVPLLLAAMLSPWEVPLKVIFFVAGVTLIAIGIYVGHGTGPDSKVSRGT